MRLTYPLVLMCLLAAPGCWQGAEPQPAPVEKDFSALTSVVDQALPQLGGKAGLLLMDKDGKVLYKQYWGGWSDSTLIPVASGSKWPSMATLMALVEDPALGLSLDDKVSRFYPLEFGATDRKDIALRQLMNHTSGLAGSSRWINTDEISLQQAVSGIGSGGTLAGNFVGATPVAYTPVGSQFAYGGVSMHIAGGIAEKVTGKDWEQLFRERIAIPCRMPTTHYQALGATTNYRIAGGAGTRLMEYANFLLMLLNEGTFGGRQVLSKASVQELLKDQTGNVPFAFTPYEGDPLRQAYRYGLGCWIEGYHQGRAVEFGDQGAFGFSPWIDTQRGIIGIFFVQRTLAAVNRVPSVEEAPYTRIRQTVRELLDAPQ